MRKRVLSPILSPFIAWVAIAFVLAGCAPVHYSDTVRAIDMTQSTQKQIETTVLANAEEWRNSGVVLSNGATYQIRSNGLWQAAGTCDATGADGNGMYGLLCPPWNLGRIIDAHPHQTLLAKISTDGGPFAIGSFHKFTAPSSGTLYLRMNETNTGVGDNSGSLTVTISLTEARQPVAKAQPVQPIPVPPTLDRAIGEKWAVIIGISQYQDTRVPSLRYPSADAQAFYEWVISPQGGRYAPSRVKLLIDEKATGKNIKSALFVWLKQAIEEDMVMIYFAGHGSPESPDSPGNLFLLPYDTVYDDLSVTGFPMWDIETALKRFIKAKKVVVIADACHSGGVGQPFEVARRGNRDIQVNRINSGLQNLSQIGDGVAVINAADETQFSQESERWGGGHGVFTFFLLKGLKGEADYNRDGTVTLGELIPFLSEKVRRETRNAQSPTVAGRFDPALTIAR